MHKSYKNRNKYCVRQKQYWRRQCYRQKYEGLIKYSIKNHMVKCINNEMLHKRKSWIIHHSHHVQPWQRPFDGPIYVLPVTISSGGSRINVNNVFQIGPNNSVKVILTQSLNAFWILKSSTLLLKFSIMEWREIFLMLYIFGNFYVFYGGCYQSCRLK